VPLVTLAAIDLAAIMTSAVLTETMFGLPGVGQLLVGAVNQVDLPVVVGVTLLTGFLIVVANAAGRPAARRHRPEGATAMTACTEHRRAHAADGRDCAGALR
jgi:hypothetical protein